MKSKLISHALGLAVLCVAGSAAASARPLFQSNGYLSRASTQTEPSPDTVNVRPCNRRGAARAGRC